MHTGPVYNQIVPGDPPVYRLPVWHPALTENLHYDLERIQKRACRIILGFNYTGYQDALITCAIPELRIRKDQICLHFAKSLLKSNEFRGWLPRSRSEQGHMTLRNAHKLSVPKTRTMRYARSSIPYMVKLLNQTL